MITQIKYEEIASCCVFALHGRFVEDDDQRKLLADIRSQIDAGKRKFLIEMKDLGYINSSGINLLVKVIKLTNDNDSKLVFTNVPAHINELLAIIKLNAMLAIRPDLDAGILYLNKEL